MDGMIKSVHKDYGLGMIKSVHEDYGLGMIKSVHDILWTWYD